MSAANMSIIFSRYALSRASLDNALLKRMSTIRFLRENENLAVEEHGLNVERV